MASSAAETYTSPNWGNFISVESVQELAKNKPHDIPERYIRSHDERPCFKPSLSSDSSIPVIDMQKLLLHSENHERIYEMGILSKACQDWGFFQLVNHGIPHSLIDCIRGVAEEFFSLPLDEKQRYARQGGDVQGYGKNFVFDEDQTLDWGDLMSLAIKPKKLVNFSLWPTTPENYRDTMERYIAEVERVVHVILSLFAENLELTGNYFNDKFGEDPVITMRMNLYPPCPRPDLVLGLSPHSDASAITLLLQDDQMEGLHFHKNNQWIHVQPIPYALVINIGDLIEVMTNGIYKSNKHRAVTNKEKARLSIGVFYHPGLDEEVAPASNLVDEEHPCLYRKFKHEEYIHYYINKQLKEKHPLAEYARIEDTHSSDAL